MRGLIGIATLAVALALPGSQASIPYFAKVRDVNVTVPDRQNYAIVDGEIWMNARSDLADLRLYAGQSEVPYALVSERGPNKISEAPAVIVNLGQTSDAAQFVIEPGIDAEYDRITLRLRDDARDFVTRAKVEGTDDLHRGPWAQLGSYPIYDFSREKLGANFTIAVPTARFSFLRITIAELKPEHIKGASVAMTAQQKARWSDLAAVDPKIEQAGRTTIVTWRQLTRAPVERLRFDVDPSQTNFRRHVVVEGICDEDGRAVTITEANIGRIHYVRGAKTLDSQDLDIDLDTSLKKFKVTIENGDDPPLRLQAVQPLTHERRIYFQPPNQQSALKLYYGDAELTAPVYDYAKLFQSDPEAVAATLGPGGANTAYTPRPDQRPWTERHGWVVWAALIFAVVGLGAVALRGLKADARQV